MDPHSVAEQHVAGDGGQDCRREAAHVAIDRRDQRILQVVPVSVESGSRIAEAFGGHQHAPPERKPRAACGSRPRSRGSRRSRRSASPPAARPPPGSAHSSRRGSAPRRGRGSLGGLVRRDGVDLHTGHRAGLDAHLQPLAHGLDVRCSGGANALGQLLPALAGRRWRVPAGAQRPRDDLLQLQADRVRYWNGLSGYLAWRQRSGLGQGSSSGEQEGGGDRCAN